jgi:hypothetical protein
MMTFNIQQYFFSTKRISSLFVIALSCVLTSNITQANESSSRTLSYGSFSTQEKNTNNTLQGEVASNADKAINNRTYQTRNQIALTKQTSYSGTAKNPEDFDLITTNQIDQASALSLKSYENGYAVEYSADFSIFDVTSILDDDFDVDGYYHTFTIQFDADVYSYTGQDTREVYALLYLRQDGGPWVHYFTTDNFIIEGDTAGDTYEVSTSLLVDYPPGNYDVLIDLYQLGYSEIVATFSSDDSNALYALPLESQNYDEIYEEEVIIQEIIVVEQGYGGSISFTGLLAILMLAIRRNT